MLGQELLRGCQRCNYKALVPLPPIRKKVIYLDQFFFSHAFRGRDERFMRAAARIKELTHLQLLVSPYSSVHEDETHQWRGHKDKTNDELMEFIKDTARGMKFAPAYQVERAQIVRAFNAYVSNAPFDDPQNRKEAIRGELDQWDNYFRIDVGTYTSDIELKRRLKNESVERLIALLDDWERSLETFEQYVAFELRESGKLYLQAFLEMARRVAEGDLLAITDSPIAATVVEHMLQVLPLTVQGGDRIERCIEFFRSPYFASVPSEWISAHLFATLREMVKRGAYSNRDKAKEKIGGIFGDISHISMYAPYCDAFVMDTPMAEIVRQPEVSLKDKYGVKVFSLRNWDELFTWLDDLEAGMSDEHKAAHAAVYP